MRYASTFGPKPFPSGGEFGAEEIFGGETRRATLAGAPWAGVRSGEWQGSSWERETGANDARRSIEQAFVRDQIARGQRDRNVLTNLLFFRRHPELGGRKLRLDEHSLVAEWKAIVRDIVLPQLGKTGAGSTVGTNIGDVHVRDTLNMAKKPVPGLGISLEALLLRQRADAGGIPIEVLLAFIHFEAGNRLFDDATAGKWSEKYRRYIPSFYELGVFQTPAGAHGCVQEAGSKRCKYSPPGLNVESSQFGKGWYRLAKSYPTAANWKDPTMQVRIGLWDLTSTGDRIYREYRDLFPSKQSEWYWRMAVLYSFAAGAGWTRAYLNTYRQQLLALPESRRWDYLRGKQAYLKGYGSKTFDPENVDKKMTLAAKLRVARGTTLNPPAAPSTGLPPVRTPQPGAPAQTRPVTSVPNMSPFAVKSPRGWNTRGGKRRKPVWGIVVHTTGSGPATIAAEQDPKRRKLWKCNTPIECALSLYAGLGGFPHYVIDYDGTVYSVAPEDHEAWHAGWTAETGGRARWARWTPPAWWSTVWGRGKTPLDLIPRDAISPNTRHIGIELLGNRSDRLYTDAQYQSLARLVVDIARRHGLDLATPPNPRLLGHEDVNPLTGEGGRADADGGWDPGAHRRNPRFSWQRLATLMQAVRSGVH